MARVVAREHLQHKRSGDMGGGSIGDRTNSTYLVAAVARVVAWGHLRVLS